MAGFLAFHEFTNYKCHFDIDKKVNMERFFIRLITVLSVPILILNVIGGIVGGIWLMVAGEWLLFLGGLAYMAFGAMILGLLLMPGMLLGVPAVMFAEKRNYVLFFIFGLFSLAYTYGLIAVSTYFVSDWVLSFSTAPLWAALLWLYAVVLAPWQYMASKEDNNSSSGMTTFFLALGIVALIISIGIFGSTLSQAFPILVVILILSMFLQSIFTVLLASEGRQFAKSEAMDVEAIEGKHPKRTWGDLE